MSLQDDVAALVEAVDKVEADVNSAEPTFADKVLAAVQPVFEAEGWTAPQPTSATSTSTGSTSSAV